MMTAASLLALVVLVASPYSAWSRLSNHSHRRLTKSCSEDSTVPCTTVSDCLFCKGGPNGGTYCGDGFDCGNGQGCQQQGTCDESGGETPSPTPSGTGGGGEGVCPDGTTLCSDTSPCPNFCSKGEFKNQTCPADGCGGRGAKCVQGECTDPCDQNPCGNGGTCSFDGNTYTLTCNCPEGFYFTGSSCEDDPCVPDPCGNGGTCSRDGNPYTCNCPAGFYFTGTTCEDNPCVPDPCGNGGTCSLDGNTYNCTCPPEYYFTGSFCIDDPCDPNPCIDGAGGTPGTCSIDNVAHICNCPDGSITSTDCQTSSYPSLSYNQAKCFDYAAEVLCDVCEGDCDDDDGCAPGLVCFVRDSNTPSMDDPVPGCKHAPFAFTAKDFCVDETIWTCKDEYPDFLDDDGVLRDCSWAQATNQCEYYSSFCRETCGYCRPRTRSSSMETSSMLVSAAVDHTWDDD